MSGPAIITYAYRRKFLVFDRLSIKNVKHIKRKINLTNCEI